MSHVRRVSTPLKRPDDLFIRMATSTIKPCRSQNVVERRRNETAKPALWRSRAAKLTVPAGSCDAAQVLNHVLGTPDAVIAFVTHTSTSAIALLINAWRPGFQEFYEWNDEHISGMRYFMLCFGNNVILYMSLIRSHYHWYDFSLS